LILKKKNGADVPTNIRSSQDAEESKISSELSAGVNSLQTGLTYLVEQYFDFAFKQVSSSLFTFLMNSLPKPMPRIKQIHHRKTYLSDALEIKVNT